MKKKNLLAMSLMGLALVACSEDEQLNGGGTGNMNGVEGELAKVTLNVSVAAPQTKGNPTQTKDQTGTEAESAIKKLTIVADYGTGKEVRNVTIPTTGTTTGGEGEDEVTVTKESDGSYTIDLSLPEGEPTFYVYANTDEVSQANWSLTLTSKVLGSTEVSADTYWSSTNGFFMSNVNGKGEKVLIDANNTSEDGNLVEVDIERAAVKVSIEVKEDADATDENADAEDESVTVGGTSGGSLHSLAFALRSTANSFYLLDQQNVPTGITYANADPTSWSDDYITVDLDKTLYSGASGAIDATTFTSTDGHNYAYCLENIVTAVTNATYLNFKAEFTPSKAVKLAELQGDDSYSFDVTGTDKVSIEQDSIPSFYVIRGVESGYDDYNNHYIMWRDLFNGDGDAATFKTGVSLKANANGGYDVTGIKGITELSAQYTAGACWFGPIYIPAAEKTYPIYRNDWYHMTVNSITLPGLPQEPTGGEEEQDANVKLSVTAIPWNIVESSLDLHE